MADAAEIPFIPSPIPPKDPPGLEEDNLGKKQMCPSPDEFMDEKENVCAGNDLVVPKEALMMPMSNRKGKRFNLRKSLAWNKAFFTEEGVLDPMEMSTLTGSVTKVSGSFQPGPKGGMSPLTRFNCSSERSRPVFQDLKEKMCNTANSSVKDVKTGKMSSIDGGEPEIDVVSVKKSPGKGILRTVLQSPFLSSQKRVANTSRTNPASKIPKFIHTKTSLPLASKSVETSTKGSKCNQSIAAEKAVGSSCTSNKDSDGFKKKMVEKASNSSKVNQDPSFQRKMREPIISTGFSKLGSSVQKDDHHICGGPPAGQAVAHVKPSSLRMPLPTMGFFSQGKVSPKYSSQPQRAAQPFISKIPPRKFTYEKLLDESRPATAQKLKLGTTTTKSTLVHVVSSRSQALSAQNCSKVSTAALGRQPDVKTSKLRPLPLHEVDREGPISTGSSNCAAIGEPVPMEVVESRIVNPSLETSSENAHDAKLFCENSGEHGMPCSNFSTQVRNSCKLQESDLNQQECDSVNNLEKNPEVDDAKDVQFSVTIEDKLTVGNPIFELEFGFTANRDDHGASMDAESSLRLNVEQMLESNDISCNSNLDLSISQGTEIPVQSLVRETCYQTGVPVQREDAVISHLQDKRKRSDGVTSGTIPLKKQINAVPFSDEWLAALESYGEGILELKTGPVQNSPPEKVLPEPGPWSPVKRKAQDIGPFDCTKYSKDLSTSETE